MTPLPEFMELNRNLILFLYGLVFFSLGTILAIQSRSYSRLGLARSLKWLAAFGILHGIYEWGHLFIPLQSPNLSQVTVHFWMAIQNVLLAFSFACLFEFGISLLDPRPWVRFIPFAILLVWSLVVYAMLLMDSYEFNQWRNQADALARYSLAFLGGLTAAYGLRRYTTRRISGLNVPHITRILRLAGAALFFYGILAGLIVPPVPFFPGSWLNNQTFVEWLNIPALVFRSFLGFVLAITMIRALEIFEIEYNRRIEALEQGQILAAERERIARELHDGALQKVYTAGLLVESTLHLAETGSQIEERLEKSVAALGHAIQDLRHNLDDLQADQASKPIKSALMSMLEQEQFQALIHIDLSLDVPDTQELTPINMDHFISIAREALTNVIRHAHAQHVWLRVWSDNHRLSMTIRDDGSGLSPFYSPGYGLRNMRDRARLLGGDLKIESDTGRGTTLILMFPLMEA